MAMASASRPNDSSGPGGFFRFRERNTTMRTEIVGGVTTFFVMAYIIFVNPSILSGGMQALPEADRPPFAALVAIAA